MMKAWTVHRAGKKEKEGTWYKLWIGATVNLFDNALYKNERRSWMLVAYPTNPSYLGS
jgi:hypothetical protein